MPFDFSAQMSEILPAVQQRMRGRSWHDDPACPPFSALRSLQLTHHGFDAALLRGELVVNVEIADEVSAIFAEIFAAKFPIERMQPVDAFDGSDDASMAANNTSCFNFRRIQGSDTLSHHALGMAIDINPVQNPWVRGARVDPPAARAFLDRELLRPGMLVRSGPVVQAFLKRGWYWGADFDDVQDYHHFSKLPR
jgi:D-alanyl-D-alanine carboxypeptidase